jgi:hypothetical protein
MSEVVNDLLALARNRRSFVKNLGLAAAAAGVVGSTNLADAQSVTPADTDILNFALNLEYLEAEFYTVATSGLTIDYFEVVITGSGTAGATTGGSIVPFASPDSKIRLLALELAADERTHVSLLQGAITALGGKPIAKPAINLNALGIGFASETSFLTLARVFEEIGVTAYGGAAPLITSKSILGYAARILAAEAEHVGFIRALIGDYGVATAAVDTVDIPPPPSGSQYFSLNSSALSAIRTPGQVLYLAFGGVASATTGGFFPSGVNGILNTSSATAAVTDGVIFTLTPNPIVGTGGYGSTTITWSAPAAGLISIRIGSPAGVYFIYGPTSGSMTTPSWVADGMVFYLQNADNLNTEQTSASTLAIAIAHVM